MIKVDEKLIKKLTDAPIIFDMQGVCSLDDALLLLKSKFSLSESVKAEWCEIEDCLEYIFKDNEKLFRDRIVSIIIFGYGLMPEKVRKECYGILKKIFLIEKTSHVFTYILPESSDNKFPDDYYKFTEINDGEVVLDFTDCKSLGEFHLVLKEGFGFPDYYGENWSALWDCLNGLFVDETQVEIRGFFSMPEELQEYCTTFFEILDDISQEHLNFNYSVES